MTDVAKYGPWAVIAGGSEGVGAEFAKRLAGDGFNLVLVARKPSPLDDTAGGDAVFRGGDSLGRGGRRPQRLATCLPAPPPARATG